MGYKTEPYYDFEFLTGERHSLSVDDITLANGQNLAAGAILAKNFVGTAAGAMKAGGTGNPTVGAITVGTKARAGTYQNIFTDATHFSIFNPEGQFVGTGVLGTAVNLPNRLTYTLTAGGTAAVAGDEFDIMVTEGASTYVAAAGSDAVAILGPATDASGGATITVAVTRFAEYKSNAVDWGTMDAAHIAAAKAALTRNNLIARGGM